MRKYKTSVAQRRASEKYNRTHREVGKKASHKYYQKVKKMKQFYKKYKNVINQKGDKK